MKNSNFFVLSSNLFDDSKYAFGEQKTETFNTKDAEICAGCGAYTSMLKWLPPYEINVSKKTIGDIIFGSFTGIVVSERFKEKFERTGFSGLYDFKNVSLFFQDRLVLANYFYPEISIVNAFVDLNNIDFEVKSPCTVCQKGKSIINRIDGVSFLNPQSIKEDIFFTSSIGQSVIFITQELKNFLIDMNFLNAKFVKAEDYKWDSFNPFL